MHLVTSAQAQRLHPDQRQQLAAAHHRAVSLAAALKWERRAADAARRARAARAALQ